LSLQDGFEIAVFVGWAGCICSLISVARHSSSEFQSIGRSRSRWFWINVLGLVPYLGIITTLSYFVIAGLLFPDKPRTAKQPRPGSSGQPQQPTGQNAGGYQGSSRGPSSSAQWQMPKPNCTRCGGNRTVSCNRCGGSGKARINGEMVPDFTCSGSGKVQCSSCGGSGKQR
jgi:hypothetical protein